MKFRKEIKLPNKLIIVKLSSLAVTFTDGHLNLIQVKQICSDISELIKKKKLNIIIVSSGSINAGRNLLPKKRKEEISFLLACSSIGQPILMNMFAQEFKQYGLFTSQVLLTHEDLKNKKRSHNIRGSISTLLKHGIIPILNENDCVSFDEITVGDNDQLSAMICETMNADLLCMLTGADGLYSKDPTQEDAIHYPIIHYEDELKDLSTLSQKSVGRGGMKTKLQAIRKLTPLGTGVVIGSYTKYTPILRLLCQQSGTLFTADNNPSNLKKRSWILTRVRDHAIIKIDQGAK
ncbi:MAG: glutamate 5-kinase, partial [Halobacteriovoraceae bacterium]|nr:glutamate 5-kinase [Halobacteriovoraceae bacterium]